MFTVQTYLCSNLKSDFFSYIVTPTDISLPEGTGQTGQLGHQVRFWKPKGKKYTSPGSFVILLSTVTVNFIWVPLVEVFLLHNKDPRKGYP